MGAAALGARGRRRGGIVGINVTPMVDVMLVLLVIMMVAATYIVSRALKVELPKSAASDDQARSPPTWTSTKDPPILVSGQPVANDEVLILPSQRARAPPGEPSLVVSADSD